MARVSPQAAQKAVNEFESEFERLMRGEYKDKIPEAAKKTWEEAKEEFRKRLGYKKPEPKAALPEPSKPKPELQQEKPPAKSTEPQTQPKPSPAGDVRPNAPKKKKRDKEEEDAGLVKIKDVVAIVRKVEAGAGPLLEFIIGLLPFDPRDGGPGNPRLHAHDKTGKRLGTKEQIAKEDIIAESERIEHLPKDEKIIALVRKARLAWRHKRKREKLKVPGVYPDGMRKIDVMRRLEGAGYKGVKRITMVAPYGGTIQLTAIDPNNPTDEEINSGIEDALRKADRSVAKQQRAAAAARQARAQTV